MNNVVNNISYFIEKLEEFKQPFIIPICSKENIKNESSPDSKGDEDMKNIRKRKDNRYEWRKQINGQQYQIINKNKRELENLVRQKLKQIKESNQKKSTKYSFIELANSWFKNYKQNIKSARNYSETLKKHFSLPLFEKNIKQITYAELEQFILSIKGRRLPTYCYSIITGVFKEACKLDIITKDISKYITKPKNKTIKGSAFKLKEQKLILQNLDKSPIKYEILFYLLTGCRREEATNVTDNDIDFENLNIYINGTKTKYSKRYIPISKKFANILKENFKNMFKEQKDYYTHKFQDFLKQLNIKNKKLHDLRHTYSTNLYYLGIPDKQRQLYMGHGSIVMTNDIYTTLEPNITKDDILNLYKDLYPKF